MRLGSACTRAVCVGDKSRGSVVAFGVVVVREVYKCALNTNSASAQSERAERARRRSEHCVCVKASRCQKHVAERVRDMPTPVAGYSCSNMPDFRKTPVAEIPWHLEGDLDI